MRTIDTTEDFFVAFIAALVRNNIKHIDARQNQHHRLIERCVEIACEEGILKDFLTSLQPPYNDVFHTFDYVLVSKPWAAKADGRGGVELVYSLTGAENRLKDLRPNDAFVVTRLAELFANQLAAQPVCTRD